MTRPGGTDVTLAWSLRIVDGAACQRRAYEPASQLAKAILKANLREYGPRLATVLAKFVGELKK